MNAINSTFIFNNREILRKKLNIRLSNSDIRGALSDVREYTQNFPTEKDILLSLYATMLNDIGSTSAAKSGFLSSNVSMIASRSVFVML